MTWETDAVPCQQRRPRQLSQVKSVLLSVLCGVYWVVLMWDDARGW
jgi:hypothetical protein